MTYIDAVQAITKHEDYKLCADLEERSLQRRSICVYKGEDFVGKLRVCEEGSKVDLHKDALDELGL